ncbi:mfs general substrate transporter [Diplodia corticola]|uniref:Mfs general substrate transporter n=1 Tax=Diplodia corticola TaxID=236234 RepID=A0A1J9S6Z4_9PEZI|nr:mfs general substrate transporter [Diplodia corticola]OJD35373.1 mfs general substrate transporter [Diplodia corticola]
MPYTLTEKTGIDPAAVQHWNSVLIAVYGAALLAFSPICGHIADRTTTRRLPLLGGLAALAGATVMLNVGSSMAVLVAGRVLQGASAAVVWVVGLALLVDTVGRQGRVGLAMGWVSAAMSLAVLVAPLLGGVVVERAGYGGVFAMAYALLGVDVGLRVVLVERRVAARWEGGGGGCGCAGGGGRGGVVVTAAATPEERCCCCCCCGGGRGGSGGDDGDDKKKEEEEDDEGKEKSAEDISPVSNQSAQDEDPEKQQQPPPQKQQQQQQTARPCPHHHHHHRPTTTSSHQSRPQPRRRLRLRDRLPPTLSLLLSRRLCASLWSTLVVSILMSSLDAVIPLYVRQTFHWGPTGAGLIFLPVVIPSFLAPAFGRLADHHQRGAATTCSCSPRWLTAAGFVAACPCWVLARLVVRDALAHKALLCALLAGLGVALAAVMPCVMAEITLVVAEKERAVPGRFGKMGAYAQAYGLFNMAWAAGALVGPIWAGYVKERAGWGTMGWSLGLLAAVSAVPAVLWTGGWVFGKGEERRVEGGGEGRA